MKRLLVLVLLFTFLSTVLVLPAMAEDTKLSGKLVIWEHTPQF